MIPSTSIYISQYGVSIVCFRVDSGRIFRSCSSLQCLYSSDLHSAKACLEKLESSKSLLAPKSTDPPAQRKTTLKWNSDGDLSAVDMARILDRISNPDLTQCDLPRDLDDQKKSFEDPLPLTSWLP